VCQNAIDYVEIRVKNVFSKTIYVQTQSLSSCSFYFPLPSYCDAAQSWSFFAYTLRHCVSAHPVSNSWVRFQVCPCGVCGGDSGTGTGLFIRVFLFSLSPSLHPCSIFTDVLSGRRTKGSLEVEFHRDKVSTHRINKDNSIPVQLLY
jgi:hypothetical protein